LHHRWFTKNLDSAIHYAHQSLAYAQKYHNDFDKTEASLMLGIYAGKKGNNKEGIPYFLEAAYYYLRTNNYNDAALMYDNVCTHYSRMKMVDEAKQYSDSAYALINQTSASMHAEILESRYVVFESLGNIDSAYHYLKQYRDAREKMVVAEEAAQIKRVTEQYQNDKKEQVIKNQRLQLLLVLLVLTVIVVATVLIIRRNRKIVAQNKIISKQVEELVRTLEQKQVLLAELQHRVKNNLQHVISILEIQKESVDFNNIDELIRGNQNRIHSMALLYKKLNVSEKVNDLEIGRYITELAELVKDSYTLHGKRISLNVACNVEKLSIEKALPLGLIIVELISNSMKHAFGKQNIGILLINLAYDTTGKMVLHYSDNGCGFHFGATTGKGLGMEIIHGLVEQLDATTTSQSGNGFQLTITF
jgi:two-component sensor histidine kinase